MQEPEVGKHEREGKGRERVKIRKGRGNEKKSRGYRQLKTFAMPLLICACSRVVSALIYNISRGY